MPLINDIQALFKTTRPSFLVLSPICIFLAYCTAIASAAEPESYLVVLVFIGAISAHISVNTFNEYADFKSGLDNLTRRTPFSGGSGSLPQNPALATAVLYIAISTLLITLILGAYFIYVAGLSLLLLLSVGVFIILAYTKWLNRQPFLCLIAPGLSFGPIYVVGAHVVFVGEYDVLAIYVSIVPFLLISNLLLLNQYPDIQADQSIGRKHFPIAYGIRKSNILYASMAALTCFIIITGVTSSVLPIQSLFSLLPMLVVLPIVYGITKYADEIEKMTPYLGMNVFVTLTTPLLLGISLLIF